MNDGGIVQTHNGYGWTSTVPNQITEALIEWISKQKQSNALILDIGAGLGVGTLPFLEAGATVVALDLDESHLASIQRVATERAVAGRLTTLRAKFPGSLHFEKLDAIHSSNVLHFLSGDEIEVGADCMFEWLKPGGKVFLQVGTIYAGHITRLRTSFEERRQSGVKWAGETNNAKDYVAVEFRDATPTFMNYLDSSPLVETYRSAGFNLERCWYYTRNGLPTVLANDGREHFGIIAERPIANDFRNGDL